MKKAFTVKNYKFAFLKIVLFAFLAFSSCDFAPDLRAKLKQYTEEVTVFGTNIDTLKLTTRNGAYIVSSDSDFVLTFYVANPQNFKLAQSDEMATHLKEWFYNEAATSENIKIEQDKTDKTLVHLTYAPNYLIEHEQGGIITPTIGLWYEDEEKKVTYKPEITIKCNSPPKPINNLDIEIFNKDDEDQTYVVVFNMPESPAEMENSIHNDIKYLLLNENPHGTGYKKVDYKFEFEYDYSANIYRFKNADKDYELKHLNDHKEILDELASYSFNDSDRTFYFETKYAQNDGDITYSFTLEDKEGLRSQTTEAYTKAWPKLIQGISVEAASKNLESLPQDKDSYIATLKFKCPKTNYYFTKYNSESGIDEVYSKYQDSVTGKSFNIEFNEDGDYELDFSSYNGSDKEAILQRLKKIIDAPENKITRMPDPLPSTTEIIITDIVDSTGKSYTTNIEKPKEAVKIPSGTFTITAHMELKEHRNSKPQQFTVTVLANRLYVSQALPKASEYGSEDAPYKTITKAANALSDKMSKTNTIDVNGNLTENVSLPQNSETKPYILKLNAKYNDQNKLYSQVTAENKGSPVLSIPDNYEAEIWNFIFNGDSVIQNNSKISVTGDSEFEITENFDNKTCSSAFNGKLTVGNNNVLSLTNTYVTDAAAIGDSTEVTVKASRFDSNLTIGKESPAVSITDVVVGGELSIGNNVKDNKDAKVTITNADVTGTITIGDNGIVTIKDTVAAGNLVIGADTVVTLNNVAVAGEVTVGKGSTLVLAGATTIGGTVTLAEPDVTTAGVLTSRISSIKLDSTYEFEPNGVPSKVTMTMANPVLKTPILDLTAISSIKLATITKDIASEIDEEINTPENKYFLFDKAGYYIDILPEDLKHGVIQISAIEVVNPIIGGFQLTLEYATKDASGRFYTATAGSIVGFKLANDSITDLSIVTDKKITIYQEGDLICETEGDSIQLSYNKSPLPAGNYQMVIEFICYNIKYSDTVVLKVE